MTSPSSASDIEVAVRAAAEALVAELRMVEQSADQDDRQLLVDGALDRCLAKLAAIGVVGKENQGPSQTLWKVAGDLLLRGDLQWRARSKPRGYAGDFEMQSDFWNRRECDDPLGRLFDRYFLRQQAVEAVRARMELVADAIAARCAASRDAEFHVVSIGSGPGIDMEQAALKLSTEDRSRLRFTLVDIDEQALDAARLRLEVVVAPAQVRTCRENLARLTRGRRGADTIAGCDVLVCSGLFDYLEEPEAAAMLRLFAAALRPGGALYAGNFAPHCTSRAYMEWIGNWYLIYRTADDMQRLAAAADLPAASTQIVAERTGADLFLVYEAPAEQ
ncbi:MAG: hypothetical protein C0483_13225 [Pirellula sp.]|nr:hypothetical protein [Pirellula sp.]